MAVSEETSALFPIFILAMLAVPLVPFTIIKLFRVASKKTKNTRCQCSVCSRSVKYHKSMHTRISELSTFGNLILVMFWLVVAVLVYHIGHTNHEIREFEPFSILGLEVGASDSELKKAFRRLSKQYHPDKNPDPEAHAYFVEYISKAYQALTDKVARENFEKFGHPDGRQGFQMCVALPMLLMKTEGTSSGIVLLAIVGICILLPMTMSVIYLTISSKYSRNFVLYETLSSYYCLMKRSLTRSKIIYVFTKASEYLYLPVRESDEEPLKKLMTKVKRELNFDPKDMKHEQARYWKQHPRLVKADLLMLAHLTREMGALSPGLQRDYRRMFELAPRLLEELMKIAILPRPPKGHGWLKPAIAAVELSQNIIQAVPLSARKAYGGSNEGIAPFLQLPHFNAAVVEKILEKNVRTLRDLRDMSTEDRTELLNRVTDFSSTQTQDVEIVLQMMPSLTVDIVCETTCEEDIREGDIVTLQAWATLKRGNGKISISPHSPFSPFHKEENYWLLLADSASNNIWDPNKINFGDESTATKFASRATREIKEGCGASIDEIDTCVKEAAEKVKRGSRLVVGAFRAPSKGTYNLSCYCLCDSWIGCDMKKDMILNVLERNSSGKEGTVASNEERVSAEEEEENDDDYDSEYSEDEEDENNGKSEGKKDN